MIPSKKLLWRVYNVFRGPTGYIGAAGEKGDKGDPGTCHVLVVDGDPVRVMWAGQLDSDDVWALEDLILTLRKNLAEGA